MLEDESWEEKEEDVTKENDLPIFEENVLLPFRRLNAVSKHC